MSLLRVFGQGFSTSVRKVRLVFYLWLANVLFSVLMIAPLYFLLAKEFSRSLVGEKLSWQHSLLWLGDLAYKLQDMLPLLVGWLAVPALLFLLLHIFLSGGILGRIVVNEKVNLPAFLSDSARYFWRFFRVFLLSILGYLVVLGVVGRGVSALFWVWLKNASSQWSTLFASLLRLLVFLLLFSVVKMFFDYVKVHLVVTESKKTFRAFLANVQFLGPRFWRAWGLFLLVGLVFVGLSLGYYLGAKIIPKNGFIAFGVALIWQQIYILALSWTSLLFFSTEVEFFKLHLVARSVPVHQTI